MNRPCLNRNTPIHKSSQTGAHKGDIASDPARLATARQNKFGRSAGFTLLEILIVMALMGLVALLAWHGLTAVSRSAAHIEQALDRPQIMTRAMTQLKLDAAAIATPTEIGFDPISLMADRLTLVRHLDGTANGQGFQVVSYQLASQALWRSASLPLHDSAALHRAVQTLAHQDPSRPEVPSASILTSPKQILLTHFLLVTRVRRVVWQIWLPQVGWTRDSLALQHTNAIEMHPGSVFDHRTDVLPAALSLQLFTDDVHAPLTREVLLGQ